MGQIPDSGKGATCEGSKEPTGSIKGYISLNQLSDYQLLTEDYTLWKWLSTYMLRWAVW
jgi:hypothetical protein